MRLELSIALAFISSLHWFQCISCDDISNAGKWICRCSSNIGTGTHAFGANCSATCYCRPDDIGGSIQEIWACFCGNEDTTLSNINSARCFTACNCTSGTQDTANASKKHISSKVVVYIILLCVTFTTAAFLTSFACCIYQKDRHPRLLRYFDSDKDTSWNSAANLIAHKSVSIPEYWTDASSRFTTITGCVQMKSFMLRSKKGINPGTIIQFSYSELEEATNNFSNNNLIGCGGSSNVYRGELMDGRTVAVKRLKSHGGPNVDIDFLNEIRLISRLNHCHVVLLLGYCLTSRGRHIERLLVFEYLSNGNLRECLDVPVGKAPINWGTRVRIAYGAARGLEYLHEAAAPRILHRDVKSTNILLDEKWQAKITDLGMAKHLVVDDLPGCSSSPARMLGTFGYLAPECAIIGTASLKSDVFSFGVVLLELISGRQPINKSHKRGEESLVIWATPRLHDTARIMRELADPILGGDFPQEEMLIMGHLANQCLQLDPDLRPSMSEVARVLFNLYSGKSRRMNLADNLFQNSAVSSSMKGAIADAERPEECTVLGFGSSAPTHTALPEKSLPTRFAMPSSYEGYLSSSGNVMSMQGDAHVPMIHIQKLMVLSTSPSTQDVPPSVDDVVDLTEPWLESFLGAS